MLLVSFAGGPLFEWVRNESEAIWIVGTLALLLGILAVRAANRYMERHGAPPPGSVDAPERD
jgi:hypothetical protein